VTKLRGESVKMTKKRKKEEIRRPPEVAVVKLFWRMLQVSRVMLN